MLNLHKFSNNNDRQIFIQGSKFTKRFRSIGIYATPTHSLPLFSVFSHFPPSFFFLSSPSSSASLLLLLLLLCYVAGLRKSSFKTPPFRLGKRHPHFLNYLVSHPFIRLILKLSPLPPPFLASRKSRRPFPLHLRHRSFSPTLRVYIY